MQTKEKIQQQPVMRDIQQLKREMRSLRSLFISMVGEDPEGNYKPAFVQKMTKAMKDEPVYSYTGSGSLLRQLKDL